MIVLKKYVPTISHWATSTQIMTFVEWRRFCEWFVRCYPTSKDSFACWLHLEGENMFPQSSINYLAKFHLHQVFEALPEQIAFWWHNQQSWHLTQGVILYCRVIHLLVENVEWSSWECREFSKTWKVKKVACYHLQNKFSTFSILDAFSNEFLMLQS